MFEFAKILGEHELEGTIQEANEDNEIVIDVSYEEDDRELIHELHDMIDDYQEENEEEDDDENEEDDEE